MAENNQNFNSQEVNQIIEEKPEVTKEKVSADEEQYYTNNKVTLVPIKKNQKNNTKVRSP